MIGRMAYRVPKPRKASHDVTTQAALLTKKIRNVPLAASFNQAGQPRAVAAK